MLSHMKLILFTTQVVYFICGNELEFQKSGRFGNIIGKNGQPLNLCTRLKTRKIFDVKTTLGNGAFGVVYKIEGDKAMKVLRSSTNVSNDNCKKMFPTKANTSLDTWGSIIGEVQVLRELKEVDGFMQLLDCEYVEEKECGEIYLKFDQAKDVKTLKNSTDAYSCDLIKYITYTLITGVEKFKKLGYIHRDLKQENLLMVKVPRKELEIKNQKINNVATSKLEEFQQMNIKINPDNFLKVVISDMGTVTKLDATKDTKGSPFYMPYESNFIEFDGEKVTGGKCNYTDKFDVYSLGLILAELHATGLYYSNGALDSSKLCGNLEVYDMILWMTSDFGGCGPKDDNKHLNLRGEVMRPTIEKIKMHYDQILKKYPIQNGVDTYNSFKDAESNANANTEVNRNSAAIILLKISQKVRKRIKHFYQGKYLLAAKANTKFVPISDIKDLTYYDAMRLLKKYELETSRNLDKSQSDNGSKCVRTNLDSLAHMHENAEKRKKDKELKSTNVNTSNRI